MISDHTCGLFFSINIFYGYQEFYPRICLHLFKPFSVNNFQRYTECSFISSVKNSVPGLKINNIKYTFILSSKQSSLILISFCNFREKKSCFLLNECCTNYMKKIDAGSLGISTCFYVSVSLFLSIFFNQFTLIKATMPLRRK